MGQARLNCSVSLAGDFDSLSTFSCAVVGVFVLLFFFEHPIFFCLVFMGSYPFLIKAFVLLYRHVLTLCL